jgi:hypothetical protein
MTKKRFLNSFLYLAIFTLILLAAMGTAYSGPGDEVPSGENPLPEPIERAYVHVIHIYDGTPVTDYGLLELTKRDDKFDDYEEFFGEFEPEFCFKDDGIEPSIIDDRKVSLQDKIQTHYNDKIYGVEKIEIQYETGELKIIGIDGVTEIPGGVVRIRESGETIYGGWVDYGPIIEYSEQQDPSVSMDIWTASELMESADGYLGGMLNFRKNIIRIVTYSTYPFTGQITFPTEETNHPHLLDTTNPRHVLESGHHYVMTITYGDVKEEPSTSTSNPKHFGPEPTIIEPKTETENVSSGTKASEPKSEQEPKQEPKQEPEQEQKKTFGWLILVILLFMMAVAVFSFVWIKNKILDDN